MRKKAIIIVLVLICCSFYTELNQPEASLIRGRVVFAKGSAQLIRGSRKMPLQPGVSVMGRDTIATSGGGLAVVKLTTGATVKINGNSVVTLSRLAGQRTRVHVHQGGMMARVQRRRGGRRFNVSTPSSVAGVRGTSFYMESSENFEDTKLGVKTGEVKVQNSKNGSEQSVKDGQGVVFNVNQPVETPKEYKWVQELDWRISKEELTGEVEVPEAKKDETKSEKPRNIREPLDTKRKIENPESDYDKIKNEFK